MRFSWGYSLYVTLYTLFWLSLTVIAYRTFLFDGGRDRWIPAECYFFLMGLLLLVFGGIRTLHRRQPGELYDPVSISFSLSGLLLVIYSNLA
ncbi:hypothetical protein [Tumebacillus permanentifrigoris]|uniref:Uncharacterized protein n=1 Tax=Tumebacillus permanentifrigoris TaxID=378543 RepID=A0A316D3T8_9BACL|nr:hypothetical protein [Tumebacillus permanentifrigoris]PWK05966.1 hypothetical protein C7459_12129 [Tumebacillus permanentifrigoris]